MRSLGTRDIEVAHRRAAQAMAELEAAHKAKQEGETRWRDAEEFSSLLELSDGLEQLWLALAQLSSRVVQGS